MEGLEVGIADPHEAALKRLVAIGAFEKAERIAVPGGDVEIAPEREVIEGR